MKYEDNTAEAKRNGYQMTLRWVLIEFLTLLDSTLHYWQHCESPLILGPTETG